MKLIKSYNVLEIKSKITFYFINCFGFSFASLYLMFRLIHHLLVDSHKALDIIYFANFCLFVFFFFISIWFIFGFEKIIIDNNKEMIEIIRSNYIYTYKKSFPINKIKRIECYEFKDNLFFRYKDYIRETSRSLLWIDMGRIDICIHCNKTSILNGLNKEECKKAFEEINKMINPDISII